MYFHCKEVQYQTLTFIGSRDIKQDNKYFMFNR